MTFTSSYNFNEKSILNTNYLFDTLRFIIINFILAFIFFFLALEEIDWFLLSTRNKITDNVIDNTSWNIKKIF